MNPLAQPDLHPDADSLSAFAERALPEPERARMVAHMAGCARCREVVYLAQSAVEAEVEAASVASVPAEPHRGWFAAAFSQWRIAWIPAAALAAIAGIAVWVQLRPAPAVNIARNIPAESAPATTPVGPAPANPMAVTPPHPATQHSASKKSESGTAAQRQESRRESASESALRAGSPPRMSAAGAYSAEANAAAMAPPVSQSETIGAEPPAPFTPAMANTQWQPPQPAGMARMAAARPVPAPAKPGPATVMALHGSAMTSAQRDTQPPAAGAAPTMQLDLATRDFNGLTAMRLAKHPRLPSGLNSVSSAIMLERVLAVDSAGAVFLSRDAGKHWETVATQWRGKAVEVDAQPLPADRFTDVVEGNMSGGANQAPSAPEYKSPQGGLLSDKSVEPKSVPAAAPAIIAPAPGTSPPSAGGEAPPLSPAMLFMLVNDRHQTWISVDGKVWREE